MENKQENFANEQNDLLDENFKEIGLPIKDATSIIPPIETETDMTELIDQINFCGQNLSSSTESDPHVTATTTYQIANSDSRQRLINCVRAREDPVTTSCESRPEDHLFVKCIVALVRRNPIWIELIDQEVFVHNLKEICSSVVYGKLIQREPGNISFYYNVYVKFGVHGNLPLDELAMCLLIVFIKHTQSPVIGSMLCDSKMSYVRNTIQELVADQIDVHIWSFLGKQIIWKMRNTDFAGLLCLRSTSHFTFKSYLEAIYIFCTSEPKKFEKIANFLKKIKETLCEEETQIDKIAVVLDLLNREYISEIANKQQQQQLKIQVILDRIDDFDDFENYSDDPDPEDSNFDLDPEQQTYIDV
jgi:PII-like signaling protein